MATFSELRQEMARLTDILIRKNRDFQAREGYLQQQHEAGKITGDIRTVLKSDLLLADLSGASKTCAVLAGAIAQVMQAELAWASYNEVRPR